MEDNLNTTNLTSSPLGGTARLFRHRAMSFLVPTLLVVGCATTADPAVSGPVTVERGTGNITDHDPDEGTDHDPGALGRPAEPLADDGTEGTDHDPGALGRPAEPLAGDGTPDPVSVDIAPVWGDDDLAGLDGDHGSWLATVDSVAADDLLNVRRSPGVDSEIVGGLEPGTRVLATGLTTPVGRWTWVEILTPIGAFWVNGDHLVAGEGTDHDPGALGRPAEPLQG